MRLERIACLAMAALFLLFGGAFGSACGDSAGAGGAGTAPTGDADATATAPDSAAGDGSGTQDSVGPGGPDADAPGGVDSAGGTNTADAASAGEDSLEDLGEAVEDVLGPYLDPDIYNDITDSQPDPDAPGPEVFVPATCATVCPALAAAGCAQGPASKADCIADCGTAESGVCGVLVTALAECRGADAEVLCTGDGVPTVAACESEEASLATCLEVGDPECEELCPALLAADCDLGPTDAAACTADCTIAGADCAAQLKSYLSCYGFDPAITCDEAGHPWDVACQPESVNLRLCVDSAKVSCADLCADRLEPGCGVGPQTLEQCVQSCADQQAELDQLPGCAGALDDVVDCAKEETFWVCHPISDVSLPVGCDDQVATLEACLAQ